MKKQHKGLAPTQNEHVADYHAKKFYRTIDDFYDRASASDFLEVNNELVNAYLEQVLSLDNGYCPNPIKNIIAMTLYQTQFITSLKESWEDYKKYTNPDTL